MTDENLGNYDDELSTGKYLFKFCRFNVNALQIILNNTIYFASPNKLNDPLDSKFKLNLINTNYFSEKTKEKIRFSGWHLDEEINLLLKDAGLISGDKKKQEILFEKLFDYIQNTYTGICSFSSVYEDNLLWSHYADVARGLCFVFDKEILINSINENKEYRNINISHYPVSYRGVKKLKIVLNRNGNLSYYWNHLFSKTKHWKYEKEFRIMLEQEQRIPLSFSVNKFKPNLNFSGECLKYIILGERMSKEHRDMLFNLRNNNVIKAEILEHKFDS